jgi:rare lipoprotein A
MDLTILYYNSVRAPNISFLIGKPNREPLSFHNRKGVMQITKGKLTTHSAKAIQEAAGIVTDRALRIGDHAVSTARIIISAEERLRQRVRTILRFAVATVFFAISGLITLGANVTTAFAKKAGSGRGLHGLRFKAHTKAKLHYHPGATPAMRGVASWYGKQFNKRKTASGVRFNTHAMMAAHRTLPFGTKVRVTNLGNQRSCVVEITDRGPFSHGRIIDLSYAAAEKLGMAEAGIAQVKLEILNGVTPSMFEDIATDKNQPVFDRVSSDTTTSIFAEDQAVP